MSKKKKEEVKEAAVVQEITIEELVAERDSLKKAMDNLAKNNADKRIPDSIVEISRRTSFAMNSYYELLCMQIGMLTGK
jgi:hypothetical protein